VRLNYIKQICFCYLLVFFLPKAHSGFLNNKFCERFFLAPIAFKEPRQNNAEKTYKLRLKEAVEKSQGIISFEDFCKSECPLPEKKVYLGRYTDNIAHLLGVVNLEKAQDFFIRNGLTIESSYRTSVQPESMVLELIRLGAKVVFFLPPEPWRQPESFTTKELYMLFDSALVEKTLFVVGAYELDNSGEVQNSRIP